MGNRHVPCVAYVTRTLGTRSQRRRRAWSGSLYTHATMGVRASTRLHTDTRALTRTPVWCDVVRARAGDMRHATFLIARYH